MTVLAIDPSSTLTGYAVMADARTILDTGLLRPDKTRDLAVMRIEVMTNALSDLVDEVVPDHILIEMPSSCTAGRIKGRVVGNAIYGFAAGAMWWACFSKNECPVTSIDAELWTQRIPKLKRQQSICMMFPKYDPETDRGGDIADAIGLACFWFSQQKAKRIVG